jgi:hypothetical protein
VSQPVLHLDFVSLNDSTDLGDRNQLIEAAAQLAELPQVEVVGVIEANATESDSDFELAFYFLLPEFTALEPFGTDARYVAFLQGAVAPRLKAFAGADVRLEDEFSADGDFAACLAIMAPEQTYDWEIREALQGWCGKVDGSAAIGIAVGEKQLYRGAALVFSEVPHTAKRPDTGRFRTTLISGKMRRL